MVPRPSLATSAPVSTATTPGGLQRRRGVEAADPRVGVDRADDDRVRLPGEVHVVEVAAAALQQPAVLEAGHGLSDAELSHHHTPVMESGSVLP